MPFFLTTPTPSGGGAGWTEGSTEELSGTVLVDAVKGNDATGGIGNGLPYKTMQAAVDAVVADNAAGGAPWNGYVLLVAPFTEYDEDVTIDVSNQLHLIITSTGHFMIGSFGQGANTQWGPNNARNINFVGSSAAGANSVRPTVVIQSMNALPYDPTTNEAYASGCRVSGKLNFDGMDAGGNLEFTFEGEVFGFGLTRTVTNTVGTTLSVYLTDARFRSDRGGVVPPDAVVKESDWGANSNLFQLHRCRHDGLLTTGSFGSAVFSRFLSGMTSGGNTGGSEPQGFMLCDMFGTYNMGGAGTLRLDGVSNFQFKLRGAALGGDGTTKTIISDLVP